MYMKKAGECDYFFRTAARESIAETVGYILKWFKIDLDVEDVIGVWDW